MGFKMPRGHKRWWDETSMAEVGQWLFPSSLMIMSLAVSYGIGLWGCVLWGDEAENVCKWKLQGTRKCNGFT